MPAITDRSKREPLLNTLRLGHGTLECVDIVKTRRFYEEVLGLKVLQTSPLSLMIRKGTNHTYAVVETGRAEREMNMLGHNGLDVSSPEEVDAAYELLQNVKDDYAIRKLQKPRRFARRLCLLLLRPRRQLVGDRGGAPRRVRGGFRRG